MKDKRLSAWAGAAYIFLLAPIAILVLASFSPHRFLTFPPEGLSLRWYENFAESSAFVGSVLVSIWIGVSVALIAVVLGTIAAFAIARSTFPGRSLLQAFLFAPIVFPSILIGLAYLQFFNHIGIPGSLASFLIAHASLTIPYTVRTSMGALTHVNTNLEDAARSLGASPPRTLLTITVPQIRPGLVAGAIFAFIVSFNDLPVAIFISGPETTTLPIRMFTYVQYSNDPTLAAISTVLVVVLIAVVLLGEWRVGLSRYLTQTS